MVARSSIGSPFLFHGQYFDYDTGLIYLRTRFYDPYSGMFFEPDPLGYEDSVNLYAGMKNNPVGFRDPSGLSAVPNRRSGAIVQKIDREIEEGTHAEINAAKAEQAEQRLSAANQRALQSRKTPTSKHVEHTINHGTANTTRAAKAEGSFERASALQARAQFLNGIRDPWRADYGTTTVIAVRNRNNPLMTQAWIATESKGRIPAQWKGFIGEDEYFIQGAGHAEQTIVNNLGSDWEIIAGGTSRNVCIEKCEPALKGAGVTLGGPSYRGWSDKTPYRAFWKNE